MKPFTAASMRKKAKEVNQDQIIAKVQIDIAQAAGRGHFKLNVYTHLNDIAKESLRGKGFEITDCPSLSIQKDGLYHIINW